MSTAAANSSVKPDNVLDWLFAGGPILCDGGMGTMLLDQGVLLDRCYEELNRSQPETISRIHAEYLKAGAQMIETNTFGANSYRLQQSGLSSQVTQINRAGVQIARQCVQKCTGHAWVAGSVGPLGVRLAPLGGVSPDEARAAFAEQIGALADGGSGTGVDLLLIETMTSLAEATEALRAAQQVAPQLTTVVMMAFDEHGDGLDGTSAETAAARLTALGADVVGCNCTESSAALRVIEKMRSATHLPLAAMPNAGIPRLERGLAMYPALPLDMADFTIKAVQMGVTLIGGCCGTTPHHTRSMKAAIAAGVSG